MLKGKDFGDAIRKAIQLKLDSGAITTKAEVARHFGIKPPSIADWIKKGSVAKEKLPEMWRYFSDVAGLDHWGMSQSEWPAGLSQNTGASGLLPSSNSAKVDDNIESASPARIGLQELDAAVEAVVVSHGWTLSEYLTASRRKTRGTAGWESADSHEIPTHRGQKKPACSRRRVGHQGALWRSPWSQARLPRACKLF